MCHHRHRGIARSILNELIEAKDPKAVGIASSHPHGILALQKATISSFDLDFIKKYVRHAFTTCNIEYLIGKNLVGKLFGNESDETVALVDSEFYIDHTKPVQALANLPSYIYWPLGKLLEGHEFVALFSVSSAL